MYNIFGGIQMEIKSGWKTTEFWLSLIGPIVALLVTFGVITSDQSDEIQSAASQVVVAIFALISAVAPVVVYVWSRTKVKTLQ